MSSILPATEIGESALTGGADAPANETRGIARSPPQFDAQMPGATHSDDILDLAGVSVGGQASVGFVSGNGDAEDVRAGLAGRRWQCGNRHPS